MKKTAALSHSENTPPRALPGTPLRLNRTISFSSVQHNRNLSCAHYDACLMHTLLSIVGFHSPAAIAEILYI